MIIRTCGDLRYFDVTGGDSVLLIDSSADLLISSALALVERASSFDDRSCTFRFGGAAGPIQFGRVTTGRALRSSARILPHAMPGQIVVEQSFVKLSSRERSRIKYLEATLERSASLRYDVEREQYVLQKNSTDPPLFTKLYVTSQEKLYDQRSDVSGPSESAH